MKIGRIMCWLEREWLRPVWRWGRLPLRAVLVLALALAGPGPAAARPVLARFPVEPPGASRPSAPGNPHPRQSGERFFATQFDAAAYWYAFALPAEAPFRAGLDRGVLYVRVPEPFSSVYVFYEMVLAHPDVRLETVVENVAGPNTNNISLVCRANAGGWYEFSITSGGYWHIWKLAGGQYTELASGPSRTIHQKRARNALAATCIGSQLALYVNDRQLGEARDRDFLAGGQVGVGVSTFGLPGAEIDFASFQARLP